MDEIKNAPTPIKLISLLLSLRIFAFVFILFAALFFLQDFGAGSVMNSFKEGFLESLGVPFQQFDAYQAGRLVGRPFMSAVLASVALYFLKRKNGVALRVTLGFGILISLGSGVFAILISTLLFATAFIPSSKKFLGPAPTT